MKTREGKQNNSISQNNLQVPSDFDRQLKSHILLVLSEVCCHPEFTRHPESPLLFHSNISLRKGLRGAPPWRWKEAQICPTSQQMKVLSQDSDNQEPQSRTSLPCPHAQSEIGIDDCFTLQILCCPWYCADADPSPTLCMPASNDSESPHWGLIHI